MEFGEKLRTLREKNGMTQQTLADQLYVTRQAVSRWECGARYPDLLMTKKIADIFAVSMDELVAGEEVKREIEKEKVLTAPLAGNLQNVLYAVCACAWLLFSIFCFIPVFVPYEEAGAVMKSSDAVLGIIVSIWNCGRAALLCCGLCLSVLGRLNAKRTGLVLGSLYLLDMCLYLARGIVTEAYMSEWLYAILAGAEIAIVYIFFTAKKKVTPIGIYLLAALQFRSALVVIPAFPAEIRTQEAVALLMVRILGWISFGCLLILQAYTLNKKRKEALEVVGKEEVSEEKG